MSALGAAAVSALGSLGSTAYSARHADQAASKGRRFAYHMATHQYQHAVKDMRKAGINPMLAAKVGGNAAPPGPTAPGVNPTNPGASAVEAYQRAQQSKLMNQQIDQVKSSEKLNLAQAVKSGEEARLIGANADQAEVMKGFYNALLPLTKDAQNWIKSATEGKGESWLKGLYDSLRNSAADALYKYDPMNKRKDKPTKGMKGGSGGKGYKLPPIEVGPND